MFSKYDEPSHGLRGAPDYQTGSTLDRGFSRVSCSALLNWVRCSKVLARIFVSVRVFSAKHRARYQIYWHSIESRVLPFLCHPESVIWIGWENSKTSSPKLLETYYDPTDYRRCSSDFQYFTSTSPTKRAHSLYASWGLYGLSACAQTKHREGKSLKIALKLNLISWRIVLDSRHARVMLGYAVSTLMLVQCPW